MPKKPKVGRPALRPEQVKKTYPLRLSSLELAKFAIMAESANMTVAAWMRATLQAAWGKHPDP